MEEGYFQEVAEKFRVKIPDMAWTAAHSRPVSLPFPSCRMRQVFPPFEILAREYAERYAVENSPSVQSLLMVKKLENYLRTYRKRAGLSQDEVGFLLGCKDGTKISRYERFTREPGLKTILGYEKIFDAPPRVLFAGTYQKVEEDTLRRAQLLTQKLSAAKSGRTNSRKLDLLRHISSGSATKPVKHP